MGGSWADDDIDIASISVPIERNKHYSGGRDPFGGHGGRGPPGADVYDGGPPYIVKLTNLPVTCNDLFIEDLFRSRYMSFVKFKILIDPSTEPLESHNIRKIAFVELMSSQDMNKALKWQDLYYKASKRVIVEYAEFDDFQHSIAFNQEHEVELKQLLEDFLSGKLVPQSDRYRYQHGSSSPPKRHDRLHNFPDSTLGRRAGSRLAENHLSNDADSRTPPLRKPNKPNPFGGAKPVDVVAKLHELDDKLVAINHTTIKTVGSEEAGSNRPEEGHSGRRPTTDGRRLSDEGAKDRRAHHEKRGEHSYTKGDARATKDSGSRFAHEEKARTEDSIEHVKESENTRQSPGPSLAELLSSKKENASDLVSSRRSKSANVSAKQENVKPVILKKKTNDATVITPPTVVNDSTKQLGQGSNNITSHKEIEQILNQTADVGLSGGNKAEEFTDQEMTQHDKDSPSNKDEKNNETEVSEQKSVNGDTSVLQAKTTQYPYRSLDRPNLKQYFADLDRKQSMLKEKSRRGSKSNHDENTENVSGRRRFSNSKDREHSDVRGNERNFVEAQGYHNDRGTRGIKSGRGGASGERRYSNRGKLPFRGHTGYRSYADSNEPGREQRRRNSFKGANKEHASSREDSKIVDQQVSQQTDEEKASESTVSKEDKTKPKRSGTEESCSADHPSHSVEQNTEDTDGLLERGRRGRGGLRGSIRNGRGGSLRGSGRGLGRGFGRGAPRGGKSKTRGHFEGEHLKER